MPPLIYLDRSDVLPGKLSELRARFAELAEFVESAVPGSVTYAVYLDEDGTRASVLHVHPDENSLMQHMAAIRDWLPPFGELLQIRSIEVFGEISDALRAELEEKARLLGAHGVTINQATAGFLRPINASG